LERVVLTEAITRPIKSVQERLFAEETKQQREKRRDPGKERRADDRIG